jgi:alpha 1,2-mannosyltransferase
MRPGMDGRRANATLLMLARNSDLDNAVRSVRRLEDRFNRHFNYPWMFLNEEPFDDEFKRRISLLTRANVTYALIPRAHWIQADWIDEERANASRTKMEEEGVIYGGSLPYRNMCRYNSGVRRVLHLAACIWLNALQFFFKHPLLQQYRWYWRVECVLRFP